MNLNNIVIHNNRNDYSEEEFATLVAAYNSLEEKAQGGTLSLDETRIRIAYMRSKQEENFRIYQPTKVVKRKKEKTMENIINNLSGAKKQSKKKEKKEKSEDILLKKAAKLLALKEKGEILSEQDELFIDTMIGGSNENILGT